MSIRDMGRSVSTFHSMQERDLKDVLARLADIYDIHSAKMKTGPRGGRPTTV